MKLTPSLKTFIHDTVTQYCKAMHLTKPRVLLTRKEVLEEPMTKGRRNTPRYYGVCYYKIHTIFINVKNHDTQNDNINKQRTNQHRGREAIRNTIIHELCHLRFPYMNDGKDFEAKIRDVKHAVKTHTPIPPYTGTKYPANNPALHCALVDRPTTSPKEKKEPKKRKPTMTPPPQPHYKQTTLLSFL